MHYAHYYNDYFLNAYKRKRNSRSNRHIHTERKKTKPEKQKSRDNPGFHQWRLFFTGFRSQPPAVPQTVKVQSPLPTLATRPFQHGL